MDAISSPNVIKSLSDVILPILSMGGGILGFMSIYKTFKLSAIVDKSSIMNVIKQEVHLTGLREKELLRYYSRDATITIKPNPEKNIKGEVWDKISQITEYYHQFRSDELNTNQYVHLIDLKDINLSRSGQYAYATTLTQKRQNSNELWHYSFHQAWKLAKTPDGTWIILEFHGGLSQTQAEELKRDMGRKGL